MPKVDTVREQLKSSATAWIAEVYILEQKAIVAVIITTMTV